VQLLADPHLVLRDYADPGNPRTVCQLTNVWVEQLIDARHVVISGSGGAYAVVDLPEVQFHWFQLPPGKFLAVSPGLDQILWLSLDQLGSGMDSVHITTSAGDRVIAIVPGSLGGRCGTGEDSKMGAYTHSGAHIFVLDQPMPDRNSLLVVEGQTVLVSVVPPDGGWQAAYSYPAWAVWSPTAETLFYRQGGDVWQWTPGGGRQPFLPGVNWYYPTITPDGGHLAYAVVRPDGLHNVYLDDLAHDGSPQLISDGDRNLPVFLNSTQLWYRAQSGGCVTSGTTEPLIYNLSDGSESPSIIDWVRHVWPATSSNY
jgi:hypothetical protein